MLNLQLITKELGINQADFARQLKVSTATVSLIFKHNRWPVKTGMEFRLKRAATDILLQRGVDPDRVKTAFEECAGQRANAAQLTEANASTQSPQTTLSNRLKDEDMLLRKHTITQDARDYFALPRDPFTNEMRGVADVFLNDNIRKVRAAVRNVAEHGGMLAVIAESGAGKSTVRKDLAKWIQGQQKSIVVIEPGIEGLDNQDRKSRPLKASDLVEIIITTVTPGAAIRQSYQARLNQMRDALRSSASAGNKHVMVIEEAHRLATQTLKHLKNFYEMDDGAFTPLLAIILIGQTELDWKLDEKSFEVREVVQRCEKRFIEPLDNDVEAYLRHKFARVDGDFDKVFAADAAEAIVARLRVSVETKIRGQRSLGPRSLCYPLAINNLVSGAMNLAHQGGEEHVTAKLVAQVGRED